MSSDKARSEQLRTPRLAFCTAQQRIEAVTTSEISPYGISLAAVQLNESDWRLRVQLCAQQRLELPCVCTAAARTGSRTQQEIAARPIFAANDQQ